MTPTIDRDQLQSWLGEGRPVTVLDVRPQEQRQDWYVPGSRHVDLYDTLNEAGAAAVDGLDLPAYRPVVTVCGAGRTSLTAAEGLARRGYDAYSLEGGMKAWGHAWNVASATFDSGVEVHQVRRTGKGPLSYLVASDGEALVIDAALEPHVYTDLAAQRGLRITGVLDTHLHADHLSRGPALAEAAGVPPYLPAQDRATFPFTPLHDGARVPFGGAALEVLHTPGHTWESSSYLLPGEAVFTGDTLFVDSVGRPDLEAKAGEASQRARALHASLARLRTLPGSLSVMPGHASAPLDFGAAPWAAPLAQVRKRVELLRLEPEAFVARLTAQVRPTPENHQRIVAWNRSGQLAPDASELEEGGNRCAAG